MTNEQTTTDPAATLAEIVKRVKKDQKAKQKPLKDFHFLHANWKSLNAKEKAAVADAAKELGLVRELPNEA